MSKEVMMMLKKKGSMGRQKSRMAEIEKKSQRQVTFSKRRAGLFKKASELCTSCGVDVAIIVFSPAKKPFSFGHPNVYSVLDRYRNNASFSERTQENAVAKSELSLVLTQMEEEEEEEKKKGEAMIKVSDETVKWSVEEMSLLQLQEMKSALEKLRHTIVVPH